MIVFNKAEYDRESPNRNIIPLTAELDEQGRLEIGGCRLSHLAKRYGTPLYILDEITLRATCKAYFNALKKFYSALSLPLYASKANSSKLLTALVAEEGFGIDVVSGGELLTALAGKMPASRILLHGNNKSWQELALALDHGATIVVDNSHDLQIISELVGNRKLPVSLMLRFTPNIECHTHEYIRTGKLDSKFGFGPEQIESIFKKLLACSWARITGLHAHIGSQIFELEPHRDLVGIMADAIQLGRSMGHPIVDLNVGGGLGICYVSSDDPPSIQNWVKNIAKAVTVSCERRKLSLPRLICEPGRSVVATAGVTLYTLGSQKHIPGMPSYLSIDGGMSDNPRPITYQSIYTAFLADYPTQKVIQEVILVGKHCESGDVLLKNLYLPKSKSGDILVVFATGAYNISMSSNYNRVPRPASVIVFNGHADLIQLREQPEDLLFYDIVPPRLSSLC
uniref:Diaminopimelate decarboxylase n=1 Tax=Paulinella chromatophora TaxID=39717 RepID=B1X5I9_PAUCH|nr:diaminopimelate decarboxylase [Paulinella chromatophora]ACB43208.1 diaminopimelate decarboxylase [Paulinella chromatophora]